MANKNHLILTYLTILSLEGMDEIYCHSTAFLIRTTPTHDNCLGVDLKISIFLFAQKNKHPTDNRWVDNRFLIILC